MLNYIIRRLIYSIPIIAGVMLITFFLFFYLTSPETVARQILGDKAKIEAVNAWIKSKGLDKPHFYNNNQKGIKKITQTLFYSHIKNLATFNFGNSYQDDKPIIDKIKKRALPSLSVTLPVFFLGLLTSLSLALIIAFFRGTYLDTYGTFLCVVSMAIPVLIYIMFFQYLFSLILFLFPVSGWASGLDQVRFVILPVLVSVIAGVGGSVRFYRTIMLEETTKDYVKTARAKGLGEATILFKHILKNAMIPILTNVVMVIPTLFIGSLLIENFFGIPGLGSFTIDAFRSNDFQSLNAIVFIGAILFQVGIVLTDISYTLVDPRVVFE